jgi:hypothetical protein
MSHEFISMRSGKYGSVTTRVNCPASTNEGAERCGLSIKASTVGGALEIARQFIDTLSDGDESNLPIEVRDGKGVGEYRSGLCIHAARIAAHTIGVAVDKGCVNLDDAVLAVQMLPEMGYGSPQSIQQVPQDQLVLVRE